MLGRPQVHCTARARRSLRRKTRRQREAERAVPFLMIMSTAAPCTSVAGPTTSHCTTAESYIQLSIRPTSQRDVQAEKMQIKPAPPPLNKTLPQARRARGLTFAVQPTPPRPAPPSSSLCLFIVRASCRSRRRVGGIQRPPPAPGQGPIQSRPPRRAILTLNASLAGIVPPRRASRSDSQSQ